MKSILSTTTTTFFGTIRLLLLLLDGKCGSSGRKWKAPLSLLFPFQEIPSLMTEIINFLSWKNHAFAAQLYSENFFVVHKAFHKKRCKIIAVIMTIKCIPHLDYYYSYFTLTLHCKKLAHKVNFKQINFAFARSKDCRMKIPRPKLLNHATFHASVIIESFV